MLIHLPSAPIIISSVVPDLITGMQYTALSRDGMKSKKPASFNNRNNPSPLAPSPHAAMSAGAYVLCGMATPSSVSKCSEMVNC